jgi:hypothetical protein
VRLAGGYEAEGHSALNLARRRASQPDASPLVLASEKTGWKKVGLWPC